MKQKHLRHQFVEFIPERLEDGVLYISQRYGTAAHKCCCGCGVEVVTPLAPTDWLLRMEGNAVTLNPSIGNWSFSCRSHYWIRRNKVVWAGNMSQRQINRGRAYDQAFKQAYFNSVNHYKELDTGLPSNEHPSQAGTPGFFCTLWLALKRWFSS